MTYNYDDKLNSIVDPKSGSGASLHSDEWTGNVQAMQGKKAQTKGRKRSRGRGKRAGDRTGGDRHGGDCDGDAAHQYSELGSDVRVGEILDVHRGTVWRLAREDPTFPRPIKLSAGATRWRLVEVYEWIASRAQASA